MSMKKPFFVITCLPLFFNAYTLLKIERPVDVFAFSAKTNMGSPLAQDVEDFIIEDNVLVKYRGNKARVVIPDGVTIIGSDAFRENESLVEVVFPEGVERIEEYAFFYCTSLENIEFPQSLRNISKSAFAGTALVRLVLPDGMERIEEEAFYNCFFLEDVQLPESLFYIEKMVFMNCNKLEKINLSSVEEIGDHAFESCALTDIDLSAVEKLGTCVFSETEIDFSGLEHLPELEGNAFVRSRYWWEYGNGKDKGENKFWIVDGVLLSGQNCRGEVIIPDTVNKIAADAFMDNHEITSVYIPDSVTEICEGAFWHCKELKMVWMEDSVEKLGKNVFFDCAELAEVYLSKQIRELPIGTFERCGKLKKYTIPEKLTLRVGSEYSHPLPFNSVADEEWKCDNEWVAEIGRTGKVCAKRKGTAILTATIYGKEYTCTVKVIDRSVCVFPCRNYNIDSYARGMYCQRFEVIW